MCSSVYDNDWWNKIKFSSKGIEIPNKYHLKAISNIVNTFMVTRPYLVCV